MNILPDEIILEIFSHFEYNEFLKVTIICKKIRNLNLNNIQLMKLYQITLLPKRDGYIKNNNTYKNIKINLGKTNIYRTIKTFKHSICYYILFEPTIKVEFLYNCKTKNIVTTLYKNNIALKFFVYCINGSKPYVISIMKINEGKITRVCNYFWDMMENNNTSKKFKYWEYENDNENINKIIYEEMKVCDYAQCVSIKRINPAKFFTNLDNKIIGYLEYHYIVGFENAMKKHIIYNIRN